jgi:hypothetical protein
MGHLSRLSLSSELASSAIVLIGSITGTVGLYTALTEYDRSFIHLSYIWVYFSVIVSLVTIAQSTGLIPYLGPDGGELVNAAGSLKRGTGFLADPNFNALNLVIAYCMSKFLRCNSLVKALLLGGILFTFSRMGILAFASTLIPYKMYNTSVFSAGVIIKSILYTSAVVLLLILLPESITSYMLERFSNVAEAIGLIGDFEIPSRIGAVSSATLRAFIAIAAFTQGVRALPNGVGAYRGGQAIGEIVPGHGLAAHNTILELFLVGGMWGISAVMYYIYVVKSSNQNIESRRLNKLIADLSSSFFVFSMLLSLTYLFIIWLLPTVAISAKQKHT